MKKKLPLLRQQLHRNQEQLLLRKAALRRKVLLTQGRDQEDPAAGSFLNSKRRNIR